jgi:hypothetical protein
VEQCIRIDVEAPVEQAWEVLRGRAVAGLGADGDLGATPGRRPARRGSRGRGSMNALEPKVCDLGSPNAPGKGSLKAAWGHWMAVWREVCLYGRRAVPRTLLA